MEPSTITEIENLNLITAEIFKSMDCIEWNDLVRKIRQEDPNWGPNLRHAYLYAMNISCRDLSRADLSFADLEGSELRAVNLTQANLHRANLRNASVESADLTESNYRDAHHWESMRCDDHTIGYARPLPDVTDQVARNVFASLVDTRDPMVCAGVEEVAASAGMKLIWNGDGVTFHMTQSIERLYSACLDNECDCEIEHACHGDCSCCPCYLGDCDCEPDHCDEDGEATGEIFMATLVGRVHFNWNGCEMRGDIEFLEGTCHPHVSTSLTACWGNASMPRSLSIADYLMMVVGWAGQHNPSSEYRDIHNLPRIY